MNRHALNRDDGRLSITVVADDVIPRVYEKSRCDFRSAPLVMILDWKCRALKAN